MNNFKTAVVAASIAMTGVSAQAQDEGANYILATASTGGTYYPVGVALATLAKVKLEPKEGIGMSAISSAGSGENVRLIREGEAQFGIMQGLFGFYAASGTGPLAEVGPQENLRSVTMLWQNVEQFVLNNDKVTSGTVDDLMAVKGMPMALGKQNSGTLGSNTVLLAGLGIDAANDYKMVHAGMGPTADAMANGQAIGAGMPSGPPAGAITKLMAANSDKFTILDVTAEQLAKMDGGRNLWVPYTIPAGLYPNQTKDINTIAQPNFLAVNARVEEEHVYLLTKTIYENLAFLSAIHPATKVMAVEQALAGLPVPLHPGAARYYKEVGIDIPERLMAE